MSDRSQVKKSVSWYLNKITGKRSARDIRPSYHATPLVGNMYMYRYDPKWKEKLPFWDEQPLTIPIEYYNDGFLGLNFHYLPPSGRKKLLEALSKYTDGEDALRSMAISYGILKSAIRHRLFAPCVKRYLLSHVRSRFEYIRPDEWKHAISLPTQRFKGATSRSVWRKSAKR